MSEDKKESHWVILNQKVEENCSKRWGKAFLEKLLA
jgi:hypothetical protein